MKEFRRLSLKNHQNFTRLKWVVTCETNQFKIKKNHENWLRIKNVTDRDR